MIDQLLAEIAEDKHKNPTTTSDKFKRDLWQFCKEELPFSGWSCVEYGTHKGQTTRILSHLFDTVFTCNLEGHFDDAKRLNQDRNNINYIGINLYQSDVYKPLTNESIDLFFIDAVHTYDAVLSDFTRSISMNCAKPCFFVFDDTGLYPEVRRAVDDLCWLGKIQIVQEIGHPKGYDFGNNRKLTEGSEGLICKLI